MRLVPCIIVSLKLIDLTPPGADAYRSRCTRRLNSNTQCSKPRESRRSDGGNILGQGRPNRRRREGRQSYPSRASIFALIYYLSHCFFLFCCLYTVYSCLHYGYATPREKQRREIHEEIMRNKLLSNERVKCPFIVIHNWNSRCASATRQPFDQLHSVMLI